MVVTTTIRLRFDRATTTHDDLRHDRAAALRPR